ncbi:MAG: TRAP transporter small permease [Kiloniellaceae bacterium]
MAEESDGKGEAPAAPPHFPDDDAPVDLSDIRPEDCVVLVLFWALAGVVFLQFFSRYVMNDSIGWTEEIARYLLIVVTFAGAALAARKNSHIAVEFFYRYLPGAWGRVFSTLVDLLSLGFFAAATWITAKLALKTNQKMAFVELGRDVIYWAVFVAFVAMTLYTLGVAWRHWRQGYSQLTRPGERQLID